jgi:membrane-bound lytic murein transglycosylase D
MRSFKFSYVQHSTYFTILLCMLSGGASANNIETISPQMFVLDPQTGMRTENLWHRLTADFQIPLYTHHPQVQTQIQWFIKNPDYLVRTTQRAAPYMYLIYEQVQQRNLPSEVVLLPMIESAYYPFSYSGVGAAGLWQLMPGTASDLGVKRNSWYDGRKDIFISTHAALNYLVTLQKRFNSDWLLAIAAYDAGPNRVQRAINNNQQQGKPTDFWSLDLPAETRAYVPRFLALANIVKNPAAYSAKLPSIENQPYLARVDIGSQIHLKEAARLANISLDDLKHLNPGYHRATTDPNGTWHLLLPIDKIDIFKQNLARATRSTQRTWGHHKTQSKDTLETIAQQYHTTVQELRRVNKLSDDILQPNTVLLIPMVSEMIGQAIETTPHSPALKKSTKKISPAQQQAGAGQYRVYYGDTLQSVAKKFGISVRDLQRWNRLMDGEQIWPNQILIIKK